MPNMSGVELAQAVRASTLVAPLPIVLLTSRSDQEARRLADEAGVDAFLVKGNVASAALIAQVMELLEQSSTD
jgi:CheY-like chemotaxis protein